MKSTWPRYNNPQNLAAQECTGLLGLAGRLAAYNVILRSQETTLRKTARSPVTDKATPERLCLRPWFLLKSFFKSQVGSVKSHLR